MPKGSPPKPDGMGTTSKGGSVSSTYELWRAKRLVVDTGLHAKRWTRQQAIDYGIEASEVERYTVFPGQACSYMIGELKILELRDKAQAALGAKFSVREFHNAVLRAGTVPLELLERQIDAATFASRGGKAVELLHTYDPNIVAVVTVPGALEHFARDRAAA